MARIRQREHNKHHVIISHICSQSSRLKSSLKHEKLTPTNILSNNSCNLSFNLLGVLYLHYKISREKFEPEPGFELRTSGFLARRSTTWAILVLMPAHVQISLLRRMPLLPGDAVMTLSVIILTTSELTLPFLHGYGIQIKLLIETKPIVCLPW